MISNKRKEVKVDLGEWVKLLLFCITLASIVTCSNSILIQKDIEDIKHHIIKTTKD